MAANGLEEAGLNAVEIRGCWEDCITGGDQIRRKKSGRTRVITGCSGAVEWEESGTICFGVLGRKEVTGWLLWEEDLPCFSAGKENGKRGFGR